MIFNKIKNGMDRVFFQKVIRNGIQFVNKNNFIPCHYTGGGITIGHYKGNTYYQNSYNLSNFNITNSILKLLKVENLIKDDFIYGYLNYLNDSCGNNINTSWSTDDMFCKELSEEIFSCKNKIESLGKVVSFLITIQKEIIESSIWLGNSNGFIDQVQKTALIIVDINLEIDNQYIPIKRISSIAMINVLSDIYNELNKIVEEIIKEIQQFKKRPIIDLSGCTKDIILKCGSGGIFIHEAIGHALEADTVLEEGSILTGYIGKKVMDSNINIIDSSTEKDEIFYLVDAYGDIPKTVKLVENGIISGIISDRLTSRKLNINNSGSGRVENFDNKPMPRMRNTFLKEGRDDKINIIKNTKDGVYATGFAGGQTNSITGDFVFYINNAYMIKNGELTNIVKPFMYVGNIFESLNRIEAIGNDLEFQTGYCGKKGQFVRVSYGQPTIKTAKQNLK